MADAHEKRNEKVARFKRDKAIAARVAQIRGMKGKQSWAEKVGEGLLWAWRVELPGLTETFSCIGCNGVFSIKWN